MTFTQQERERLCALSFEIASAGRDVAPAATGEWLAEIARQLHEIAHSSDLDYESSASRQHYIDTGKYLTNAERAAGE